MAGSAPGPLAAAEDEPGELRIGARLRHLRRLNGLRLKDVAGRAGCSESMLSKIENDRVVPSLTTLHRLCRALNTTVSSVVDSRPVRPWTIQHPDERPVIGRSESRNGEGTRAEVITPSSPDGLLEGFVVIIEPGGHSGGPLQHAGEEAGYVLQGELELTIAGETHRLAPGDSFHFPSNLEHSYGNPGTDLLRVVWINTPPSF